jgi:hypothetical protein
MLSMQDLNIELGTGELWGTDNSSPIRPTSTWDDRHEGTSSQRQEISQPSLERFGSQSMDVEDRVNIHCTVDDDLRSLSVISAWEGEDERRNVDEVEARGESSRALQQHIQSSEGTSRYPLSHMFKDADQDSETVGLPNDTMAAPVVPPGSRFTTVVDRGTRMIIDIDDEDDDSEEGTESQDDQVSELISPILLLAPPDPSFVTDGRGRVVWSSSGFSKVDEHDSKTQSSR